MIRGSKKGNLMFLIKDCFDFAKFKNKEIKIKVYPKNLAPEGPSSKILEAMASPSIRGGG